jgi:vancomycin resistance protein YoaR
MVQSKFYCKITLAVLITAILSACSARRNEKPPDTPPAKTERMLEEGTVTLPERTVKNNVHLGDRNIGGLKEPEVREIIADMARKVNAEPKNAEVDSGTWEVIRGKAGKRVNVEKILNAALTAEENSKVKLLVEDTMPAVTSDMLAEKIKVIGSYTTNLIDKTDSRVNNIDLASGKIDQKKLLPGEEFSFNKTVGRRTQTKGYEEAPIIVRTEEGPKKGYGVGGGICQLSTTIYNAIEECSLEVTERHLHSKNVGYVPKGDDATVAYGSADFKFRNNRQNPIMIRVYSKKNSLTVQIIENRNA